MDDPTVQAGCLLSRRFRPQVHLVSDGCGGERISSGLFKDPELSIQIEECLSARNRGPVDVIVDFPEHDVTAITASVAREQQQAICRDPLPGDECHGLVLGKKTGAISRRLAESATEWWRRERRGK